VRLITSQTTVSRLSRKCAISNISQHYRPRRSVMGMALLSYMYLMFVPHRKHTYNPPRTVTGTALHFICTWCSYLTVNSPRDLHGVLRGQLHFLYTDVRTSQETLDLRGLLRRQLYIFTCTWCTHLNGKHICSPPQFVMEIALLSYT
jgi:hypothetical protein